MLLRLHQKIAPEWVSNLVGLFEILSFARGSDEEKISVAENLDCLRFRCSLLDAISCRQSR
jgi:hypothetical protein